MTNWVQRTGQQQFKEKASAILQAVKSEWTRDVEEFNFDTIMAGLAGAALREAINQTQNGQGIINAAELYMIADYLNKPLIESD